MAPLKLVGLSGSYSRPSKTTALVQHIAGLAEARYGLASAIYDLGDFGPSLGQAQYETQLDESARQLLQTVVNADILVVGSPTYQGSYPGLFKHLIDLIDPLALKGKQVILSATGGGDRHALMVEHQLRPLFGFFMAHTLPSAVYASDRDFLDYQLVSEPGRLRAEQAVGELAAFLPAIRHQAVAAE